jgi:hypothetical protein
VDRTFAIARALALSFLAALGAATQLSSHFGFYENLGLLIVPITGFACVALAAFGLAAARSRGSGALGAVAAGLAIVALLLVVLPGLVDQIAGRSRVLEVVLRGRDGKLRLALLIPMLLVILIQWRVVRRGWFGATAPAGTWPWITTILACVVILNPLGLEILIAAIEQRTTDWLRELWRAVALAGAGVLLLIALVEWRIRSRRLRATGNGV